MGAARIAIVDDNKSHIEIYKCYLEGCADMHLISESMSGEDAIVSIREKRPDIVLLDFQLTGMTGIEVAKRVKAYDKTVKVLSLTSHTHPQIIDRMIHDKNIDGVGLKGSKYLSDNFTGILRYLLQGDSYLDPSILGAIRETKKSHPLGQLTGREFEVFMQMSVGRGNEEISNSLCVDVLHVKNVRSKVNKKLKGLDLEGVLGKVVESCQKMNGDYPL